MHLDGLVDDLAALLGHHRLHGTHPHPRLGVAEHVHGLRGTQHHQAHRLHLDTAAADDFHVLAEVDQLLAEALTAEATVDHHLDRLLGNTHRTHAVVDAARPEAKLRDLEATAFAEQDVVLRHAHVGEADVHVAVGCVVAAEHFHRADDLDPGGVDRHEDLALLLVGVGVRAGAHHRDHDLAARIAGARDVELLAVDHPFVAVEHGRGLDLLGVAAHDAGLGHRVGRADLAAQQRLEPALLLLRGAHPLEHLHVAGVGRRAVEALAGQTVLAEFDGDVGVVEVAQALAGVGVGQEEVPQALGTGLGLHGVEQFELARRPAPAIGPALTEAVELLGDRVDLVADECPHGLEQRADLVRHPQVEIVHARHLQCATDHVWSSSC